MRYINACKILPQDLVRKIQEYIDGEYVYIPRKRENKKSWGERNGSKKKLNRRNAQIFLEYVEGKSVVYLAKEYFLSENTIKKIISIERNRRVK